MKHAKPKPDVDIPECIKADVERVMAELNRKLIDVEKRFEKITGGRS